MAKWLRYCMLCGEKIYKDGTKLGHDVRAKRASWAHRSCVERLNKEVKAVKLCISKWEKHEKT